MHESIILHMECGSPSPIQIVEPSEPIQCINRYPGKHNTFIQAGLAGCHGLCSDEITMHLVKYGMRFQGAMQCSSQRTHVIPPHQILLLLLLLLVVHAGILWSSSDGVQQWHATWTGVGALGGKTELRQVRMLQSPLEYNHPVSSITVRLTDI